MPTVTPTLSRNTTIQSFILLHKRQGFMNTIFIQSDFWENGTSGIDLVFRANLLPTLSWCCRTLAFFQTNWT